MKMRKILMGAAVVALSGAGLGYTLNAKAATDNLQVDAVIVEPLDITCATPLNFGSIDAGAAGGTVTVPADGTAPTFGGTTVGITGFAPSVGQCTTSGEGTLAYTVTIPDALAGVDDGGGNTMDVINFTVDDGGGQGSATAGYSTALVAGAGTLDIGADLVVGAAQAPGTYQGFITVTAIYD